MSERPRRSDFAVALFVTIFWAAVVFAVDGIIAIVLDRDRSRRMSAPTTRSSPCCSLRS
jgi:hypothetical protein